MYMYDSDAMDFRENRDEFALDGSDSDGDWLGTYLQMDELL